MPTIIVLAPLLGALIAGFGHRAMGERPAMVAATGLLLLAAFLSWIVFFTFDGPPESIPVMRWIHSGAMEVDWAIRLDRLTAVMLVVITSVSALVHIYSFGYMDHDANFKTGERYKARFFAYLSFFTFAMLTLVTADNLVQLFFGWEGVGVASYLLIGFYFRKPSAGGAAMKAFIVNRVGDFGFALGIFAVFYLVDSVQFDVIFAAAEDLGAATFTFVGYEVNAAETIAILLFIGAMGKSAQLLLHTWLPDAMEGPTPVSALIHAATMVTAGVFLVCRMSPIMEYAPGALAIVTVVGATTAIFAATVGLVQNDIKRVIAYSTCSQLGYMFAAAGVGRYQAAMFHLFTHAAFKAMLFLGAGSVIHAMHHEQDMRNYGGLRTKIPITFWTMMIGTLAITGVGIPLTHFGFAGFLSKDAIIEGVFAGHSTYAFMMLDLAATFTSFYSWRLMFLTFYGAPRGDAHTHDGAHESPRVMTWPLLVLAVGSVLLGMVYYEDFVGYHAEEFFGAAIFMGPDNHVLHDFHDVPKWVKASPFAAMLIGFGAAWLCYIKRPEIPGVFVRRNPGLYKFLLNKWYFDELYQLIFLRPAQWLGLFLWKRGDGGTIDAGINGLTMRLIPYLTRQAGRAQSGFLFHYAFAMFIGLAVILTLMVFRGGG